MTAKMVEVKTAELEGAALDWAVGIAAGFAVGVFHGAVYRSDLPGDSYGPGPKWQPSTDWAQGGPLIEPNPWALPYRATHRYHIGAFEACTPGGFPHNGKTPLIAACRAIVAAKLGDSVMVPEGAGEVMSAEQLKPVTLTPYMLGWNAWLDSASTDDNPWCEGTNSGDLWIEGMIDCEHHADKVGTDQVERYG